MARDISHLSGDLIRRGNALATSIERAKPKILRSAGMTAKTVQQDVLKADAGGDLRLSRAGRGGRIGARFDVRGDTVTVSAIGAVPLLANPIRPHRIPKAGRRKVIAIPGVGVRASANHPGTRGKDSWDKGQVKARPKVTTVIGRETDLVVRKAFMSGG